MTGLRILITGSRNWSDWHTVEVARRHHAVRSGVLGRAVTVVHGAAPGADACADVLAHRMGFTVERHRADWDNCGPECDPRHRRRRADGSTYCPAAGPRRNAEMVALGADICLAFPLGDSPGSRGCMALAEKAGIPVVVHEGVPA